ncbi:Rod binding protein [Amphiplicatus metriothermophilus]|uniref:Rod binding protein n=2 Tax=Amphiplicatus metriothermophilus TaxID=1519374 RepID=A0A239PKJ6_9PROT|nr:Rod binding protein [Amphiplicatus metriothermophilus]
MKEVLAAGIVPSAPPAPHAADPAAREAALRESARAFEAAFLAQMLTHSGLAKSLGANGGFGGEAFSGLLVEQYAAEIVEQGGFGLAEKIYEQLRDKDAGHADR